MLSYIRSDEDRAKSYITLAQEKKLYFILHAMGSH